MPNSSTKLFLLIGIALMASTLFTVAACVSRYPTEVTIDKENQGFELKLDFQPFKDPVSLYVFIDATGRARGVSYNNYQLAVLNEVHGSVPEAEVTRTFDALQNPTFQDALRHRDYTGEGLSRGDQFYLAVKLPNGRADEMFGFIDDTPPAVRNLIESLRSAVNQLHKSTTFNAYIRGRPIAKDRFSGLQNEGKIRIAAISDLPSPLQTVMAEAITRTYDFIGLTQAQYDQLLTLSSQGHDLFIADHGSGYQFTLFRSVR